MGFTWADTRWRDDVRMGWRVTDQQAVDGVFWAVRNSDGKTLENEDRWRLLHDMAAADIVATYRRALPETLD